MKRGRRPHPDILTPREWEVLELIRDGLSNEAIAARLGISIDGAKYHVSEILTKLGVPDRLAAARWRPERERQGLAIAWFSFGSWWRPYAARALGAALVAGAGVLVWGLFSTQGDEPKPSLAQEPTPAPPAVVIFDTEAGSASRLPGEHNITFARWLEDGETFIAYDIDVRAWKVYDVAGNELRTLLRLPRETAPYVTAHLDASPQGDVAILTRGTPPDRLPSVLINTVLLDLDSLAETPLVGPPGQNTNHLFSPDGRRLAFTNENAGQGFLMVGNANEGDATTLRSASLPDDWSIPIQWSPDGSQLLIRSNGPESSNPSYEVIDLSGASVWQLDVPAGLSFTGVQWAGPGRVLIGQQDPIADVAPPISRRLIRIADGGELPLPASLFNAALRLSPNGLYAIARERARNANEFGHRFDVRCSLVDFTTGLEIASEENLPVGYCGTVDWTLDSRFVIVTGGGN